MLRVAKLLPAALAATYFLAAPFGLSRLKLEKTANTLIAEHTSHRIKTCGRGKKRGDPGHSQNEGRGKNDLELSILGKRVQIMMIGFISASGGISPRPI